MHDPRCKCSACGARRAFPLCRRVISLMIYIEKRKLPKCESVDACRGGGGGGGGGYKKLRLLMVGSRKLRGRANLESDKHAGKPGASATTRFSVYVARFSVYVTRFSVYVTRFSVYVTRFSVHVTRFSVYVTCHPGLKMFPPPENFILRPTWKKIRLNEKFNDPQGKKSDLGR